MHDASISTNAVIMSQGTHVRAKVALSFDIEDPFTVEAIFHDDSVAKLWTLPVDMLMRAVYLMQAAQCEDARMEPLADRLGFSPLPHMLPENTMLLTLSGMDEVGEPQSAGVLLSHMPVRHFLDQVNEAITRSTEKLAV